MQIQAQWQLLVLGMAASIMAVAPFVPVRARAGVALAEPTRDWRARPSQIFLAPKGDPLPRGLTEGRDVVGWKGGRFALEGPKVAERWMLAYSVEDLFQNAINSIVDSPYPITEVIIEESVATATAPASDPQNCNWAVLSRKTSPSLSKYVSLYSLQQQFFDVRPGHWYRVVWEGGESPFGGGVSRLIMGEMGLYRVEAGVEYDYWLMLGSSIEISGFTSLGFKDAVRRYYPEADPLMVNLSIGGAYASNFVAIIADILKAHPHARYVAMHVGGDDITDHRPWPGGSVALSKNLEAIAKAITDAKKIPILVPITFRNYRTGYGDLDLEANGSLTYNVKVLWPLIRTYSPEFIEPRTQGSRVDGYAWFRDHRDQFRNENDFVHFSKEGMGNWERLWAEGAGTAVYGAAPDCSGGCLVPHPVCGDGNREDLEQCDDGNTTSGDGCSDTCVSENRDASGPSGKGANIAVNLAQNARFAGCAALAPGSPLWLLGLSGLAGLRAHRRRRRSLMQGRTP